MNEQAGEKNKKQKTKAKKLLYSRRQRPRRRIWHGRKRSSPSRTSKSGGLVSTTSASSSGHHRNPISHHRPRSAPRIHSACRPVRPHPVSPHSFLKSQQPPPPSHASPPSSPQAHAHPQAASRPSAASPRSRRTRWRAAARLTPRSTTSARTPGRASRCPACPRAAARRTTVVWGGGEGAGSPRA